MKTNEIPPLLQEILHYLAVIVRFGGSISVLLIMLALYFLSDAIARALGASSLFTSLGDWAWVFMPVALVLSLLIIYGIKRVGGLEK
jgi:uncharacterized membrane protein HdeD (DUF308 family)